MGEKPAENPLPRELFDILACPDCKAPLKYSGDKTSLICTKERTSFPIEDGIPVLLPKKGQEPRDKA